LVRGKRTAKNKRGLKATQKKKKSGNQRKKESRRGIKQLTYQPFNLGRESQKNRKNDEKGGKNAREI